MPYHVEIDEAVVLAYMRAPERGLAESDLDTLLGFLEGLADTGDVYRQFSECLRRDRSAGNSAFNLTSSWHNFCR